jgi:hypothetical protein
MSIKLSRETIQNVCRKVKPDFQEKLGEYTHKRVTDHWYFHGLGFVKEGMLYVFGINLGFFQGNTEDNYSQVGMNVLVRTNGSNRKLRNKFKSFFAEHLKDWINQPVIDYLSERGGVGKEFAFYKPVAEFETEDEIVDFLKQGIDSIKKIYPKILKNPEKIFDDVLRAAPMWELTLLEVCQKSSE